MTNENYWKLPETYYKIGLCDLLLQSPHVLIGGATGSGKSVLLDDIIYTIISTYTPNDARIILLDPKRVTFTKYRYLPHVEQIQTETGAIMQLLHDLVLTMEHRYKEMQEKNIVDYDGKKIFVIFDEIADFMTKKEIKGDFIRLIQRLTQLGRASKIMLIGATQCPNRKIIPAEIVVNFTGRVALRCLSAIESRQLLNKKGAETLPRHGSAIYLHCDGLFYTGEIPYFPERIQERIDFWLKQGNNNAYFKQTKPDFMTVSGGSQKIKFSPLNALLGDKPISLKAPDLTDFETQNILSIIDDD